MFHLDTRISTALSTRPELRELLPAFHPAFSKLNHPVLGRIMPRLVTVRDAARVAGVDAEALLQVMNLPGPPDPGTVGSLPDATREPVPPPPWLERAPVAILDLRDTLAAGEEPLPRIMAALRSLLPGAVLQTLTPFEPAPLRTLVRGRGWESHVAWEGDTCHTSFFRLPDATTGADAPAAGLSERLHRTERGVELDVRGLEPPQPLRAVMAALDAGLVPLTLRHHRRPALLFPRLEARGLWWTVEHEGEDVIVTILARPEHAA